ncbi:MULTISPECIES: glycosyltransferase [Providencia]|uniref:glycosyltransferase n=1 Tax=Providencia TaxID=586 RepID=UPI001408B784|nr:MULTISPECIES: glycosyltransferase [unclassified Providencia]EJD6539030.1 lipopolysaccharide 1,3-galactosyltransferase [Providencia rettgeri]ELQ1454751.1 lipopolysaccharide 1,3-galactosyltransferase [Providencia rettgeri]ELR5186645.1 lipopolysaccharide 1,3-galactosyltransferase [Providencia rettgeri]EMB0751204.1 lipopolysaccharide 1,3-galactosyltransferase [Providencia rettgeri]
MIFPEDIVKEKVSFSFGNTDDYESSNVLNIAYGADEEFLFGTGVSIASILLKNNEIKCNFHIFTDNLSLEQNKLFSDLAENYGTNISVYRLNTAPLKNLPTNKLWSNAIYFRLIIADFFFEKEDKVLYLDSDIICNGRLNELNELNLASYAGAAITDRDSKLWEKRAKELDCPKISGGYFNSGVMLINIKKWHSDDITSKTIGLLSDKDAKSKFSYYDQDALNIALAGKVLFLDKKYNTQFSINYELKKNTINPVTQETIFIHYIGATKPWNSWSKYPSTSPFMNAMEKSPWKNEAMIKPKSSMQYRYAYKHMFNQGNKLKGIKYFILYLMSKLK